MLANDSRIVKAKIKVALATIKYVWNMHGVDTCVTQYRYIPLKHDEAIFKGFKNVYSITVDTENPVIKNYRMSENLFISLANSESILYNKYVQFGLTKLSKTHERKNKMITRTIRYSNFVVDVYDKAKRELKKDVPVQITGIYGENERAIKRSLESVIGEDNQLLSFRLVNVGEGKFSMTAADFMRYGEEIESYVYEDDPEPEEEDGVKVSD